MPWVNRAATALSTRSMVSKVGIPSPTGDGGVAADLSTADKTLAGREEVSFMASLMGSGLLNTALDSVRYISPTLFSASSI